MAFIMVNPSTANAETDDATIRKVRGFTQRLGYGRVLVGNLFAYRATDIRALRAAADPVGPDNDGHLKLIMCQANDVIVAWGPMAKLPAALRNRYRIVLDIAQHFSVPLYCLGMAKTVTRAIR